MNLNIKTMLQKSFRLAFILVLASIISISCKKDDPEPDPPVVEDEVANYAGSGSEGDLITFDMNKTKKTYTVFNETTGEEDKGEYTIIGNGGMQGIYEVTDGGDDFYAVELTEKIIAANFPTGNPKNTISFGVSSELDNTDNGSTISGDYVFMVMDNDGIMNDPTIKEWGLLSVYSNNTWEKTNFATNTGDGSVREMSPDLYTGGLPVSNVDESGTWNVDGDKKERLNVTVDGGSGNLTGYAYATSSEAAFLLDLGTGNGFLLGLKITSSSFGSIAGDYKFVNVWDDGRGAGNYSISSSGKVDWTHDGSDGGGSGSFQLTACDNVFENVFYAKSVEIEPGYLEDIYCVIVGDIIMHFSFDDSNGDFAQYGAGARID